VDDDDDDDGLLLVAVESAPRSVRIVESSTRHCVVHEWNGKRELVHGRLRMPFSRGSILSKASHQAAIRATMWRLVQLWIARSMVHHAFTHEPRARGP
jgi:hypothetical protein